MIVRKCLRCIPLIISFLLVSPLLHSDALVITRAMLASTIAMK